MNKLLIRNICQPPDSNPYGTAHGAWIVKQMAHGGIYMTQLVSRGNAVLVESKVKYKNPMHVDSDYAISYGFREKIVHGNILNVFLSFVIGELLSKKNIVIIDQSIKYKKPLYVGMKIEIHLFLVETI